MIDDVFIPSRDEFSTAVENVKVSILIDTLCSSDNPITNITDHTHPCYEIFACSHGKILINSEIDVTELNTGEIAIVPIGLKHHMLTCDNDAVWSAVGFTITKHAVRCCHDLWQGLSDICKINSIIVFRNASDICRELLEIFKNITYGEYCILTLKFTTLLLELHNISDESVALKKKTKKELNVSNRSSQLESVINLCFMEKITIDVLADKFNISKRQLLRMAKKQYSITLHQAIIIKRLDTAKKMLLESEQTIIEISNAVGFTTVSSFYRNFKRQFGMTPIEFRKQNK